MDVGERAWTRVGGGPPGAPRRAGAFRVRELLLLVAVAGPAPAAGQVALDAPEARFPQDFGSVQTVRELPDGTVLVADPLGRALYRVDMEAGTRAVVGRQGQGPAEYMQPDAVWPLPADSSILVDLGNGRLVALGPDLAFGPTMPIAQGDPRPGTGAPFTLALPQAVDGSGRIYARALAARGRSLVGLVGSATAPDPRRHDDGIAMSYVEECQRRRWGCAAPTRRARGGCGTVLRHSSSPMSSHRIRRSSLSGIRKTLVRGPPDFYHGLLGMGGGASAALPDSGAVLRFDRATRTADTAAVVKLRERVQAVSGGANERAVRIEAIPLSPEDSWGVAPDGSVVVARAGSGRVDWIGPDGSVTRGPAVPYDPVPIGTAEKEAWLVDEGRSGGGVAVSVSIENGAVSTRLGRGMSMSDADREVDQYTWPERMAPFRAGRVPVDPAGRAWVGRSVAAGEAATYELFDRTGRRVETVRLSPGARVVGFGRAHVYVATFDDFDLAYLERHRIP